MKVILVGVSCVGKSTIGKRLADELGYKFIDFDNEVEDFFNKKITELKREFINEYYYRKNASKVLNIIMKENEASKIVVAMPPSGLCEWYWKLIKKSDWITIFIDDSAENIIKRIVFYDDYSNLINKTLTEKEKSVYLYEIKEDIKYFKRFYRKANYKIDISGLDIKGSVNKLKVYMQGKEAIHAMNFIRQFDQCSTMAEGKIFVELFLAYITDVNIPLNQKQSDTKELLTFSKNYYQNISSESEPFLIISENYTQYIIATHLQLGIDQNMTYLQGLCKILIDLCCDFKVATGTNIKESEVEYLLNTEKGKKFCKIASEYKPLVILNILERHVEYNSVTLTYFNTIINSIHKLDNQDRIYVLAHELGHILQYSKTNSHEIYPIGFYDMFEKSFNNKILNVKKEDLTEIFADCFSVYFMIGTKYECDNPFMQIFTDESIYIINEFFETLMSSK